MSLSVDESPRPFLPPRDERKRRFCRRGIVIWFVLATAMAGSLAVLLTIRVVLDREGGTVAVLVAAAAVLVIHRAWLAVRDVRGAETFPARHWENTSGCLPIAIGLSGLLVAFTIGFGPDLLFAEDSLSVGELAGAILAFFCIQGLVTTLTREAVHHVRVYPYFSSKVGDIHTYAEGYHVARHLGELDELARSIDVAPLSTFGWNDDRRGEPLVWHDSAEGLRTVKALMAALEKEDFARADHSGIIEDLKRIAHALDRAQVQGIAFCLLLQHGDGTNAMEHEQRKGTFF